MAWFAFRDFGRRVEWGQLERGGGGPGVRSTIGPTHLNQYGEDPRMGQDRGRDQDLRDGRIFQDRGVPFPPLLPSIAPFSLPPAKIIWQCYSELCPSPKNTLPAPLEVKVFCPYLCTTPQGRDGRRATDIRDRKTAKGSGKSRNGRHRKRASKNI